MTFIFKNFPMSPSVNEIYSNVAGRGRIKTPIYRCFERDAMIWNMKNSLLVQDCQKKISEMPISQAIRVNRVFSFPVTSILNKLGRPKRNDTANRIKALDDAMAAILGVDDCIFWSGSEDKVIGPLCVHIEFISIDIMPVQKPQFWS